jgi:hypothetical protein
MKRVFRSSFAFLFFVFLLSSATAQKNNWPKTLLWKISGNGLTKPSYLFGTMHLQDKRVFNLGDSFYHHFERAEGFAIEVDFREYMDSLLTKGFQLVEDRNLKDEEEELSEAVVDSAVMIAPPPPAGDLQVAKSDAEKRMPATCERNSGKCAVNNSGVCSCMVKCQRFWMPIYMEWR